MDKQRERKIGKKLTKLQKLLKENLNRHYYDESVKFIKSCYDTVITNQLEEVSQAVESFSKNGVKSLTKQQLKDFNTLWKKHQKIEDRFEDEAKELYETLKRNSKLGFSKNNKELITEFSERFFDYSPTPEEIDSFTDKLYEIIIQE